MNKHQDCVLVVGGSLLLLAAACVVGCASSPAPPTIIRPQATEEVTRVTQHVYEHRLQPVVPAPAPTTVTAYVIARVAATGPTAIVTRTDNKTVADTDKKGDDKTGTSKTTTHEQREVTVETRPRGDNIVPGENPVVNRQDFVEAVVNALVGTRNIVVVNRAQLGEVIAERGRTDDEAIRQVARLAGAEYLIVATPMTNSDPAAKADRPVAVILNMTSVATGIVTASARAADKDVLAAVGAAARDLSQQVAERILGKPPQ